MVWAKGRADHTARVHRTFDAMGDSLDRARRIAYQQQRAETHSRNIPLGEMPETGGRTHNSSQSGFGYDVSRELRVSLRESLPKFLQAEIQLDTMEREQRAEGRNMLTYVAGGSDNIRYLFVPPNVLDTILDSDGKRSPENALLLRDSLDEGRYDLTVGGYHFVMEHYSATFTDDPLLGEVTIVSGQRLEFPKRKIASSVNPRSTILALNSGWEEGGPEAITNTLTDKLVTGRFHTLPSDRRGIPDY